jgi:integrase
MKGSICYHKQRKYYYVSWLHKGKRYKIYRYNGEKIYHPEIAKKLVCAMQWDVEHGFFRIEKYTKETPTDVMPYMKKWLGAEKANLSPATYKDYLNSITNHLVPWFKVHPVQLHEIRYDTLCQLLGDIKRTGKGKLNVIYCLHRCLDYAWKSGRIPFMPPFPERSRYNIDDAVIEWLPEARQIKVIEAIPVEHQPIFWWLKHHFRRPSEAMALHKEDYDKERDVFTIRRAFSNKELVQHTKTHKQHVIPCHPDFKPIMEKMPATFGPYFFVNPTGKLKDKHYQHDFLVDLWNKACGQVGESIRMYAGLKHSSCCQFVNEYGGSIDQLQMLTDHARRDSVLKYTEVKVEAKRKIVADIIRLRRHSVGTNQQIIPNKIK